MTTQAPEVSVIVAAWKAAVTIERAVTSALASQDVTVEVVIVDDASSDTTWDVLQTLATSDNRIRVDRLASNGGPSAARNRAVALASGRYIAVLDADDTIAPDRLAALVALADARNADIAVDNMVEVDEAGLRIGDGMFLKSTTFTAPRAIDLDTWIAFNQPMQPGDCLGYLKPLIRRATLERLGVGYDPALRNSEDYYLIADLLAGGARMTYAPTAGYHYTRAAGSTSHRLKPEQTRAWLDAETRFSARHGAALKPDERSALARRMRALKNVNQFVAATDALKSRRLGAFFGTLASDAGGAIFTLSTFAKIAAGKLLRRKFV